MRIDIITIFPEYFGPLGVSLIGKAADRGEITFGVHDLRDWAHDLHRTVDDAPFGGGPGMVMKPEPWSEALAAVLARGDDPPEPAGALAREDDSQHPDAGPLLVIPTPTGVPFTQQTAERYASESWLIFACGRY
ncbi:MAG TPA: tRNA (guanosine(37)-N1)-methyltransferase TrmD, partial [Streptosporangiaceae bacterium]